MTDPEPTDAVQVVRDAWPTCGPCSPEQTLSASEAVYELIRFLNYATREARSALPFASFGYRLAGELATTSWLQPQLYRQLAQWAESFSRDPALGHSDYRGNEIDHTVAAANAVDVAQCFAWPPNTRRSSARSFPRHSPCSRRSTTRPNPTFNSVRPERRPNTQTATQDDGGHDE